MIERPLIYFAFSNQKEAHLDCLKKESRNLFRTLQPFHDKQIIEVFRDESLEIEELFDDMRTYGNRMVIFHYSGHAGSDLLWLEDGKADAGGFAKLLETIAPSVQLVFLNGCSTCGHVQKLFDKKCRIVIATDCPIGDIKATEFSTKFYEGLASGLSIQVAFDFASAYLATRYAGFEAKSQRGIGRIEPNPSDKLPWGLYENDQLPAVTDSPLKWELPRYERVSAPRVVDANYEVNQDMIQIVEEMAKYDPSLAPLLSQGRRAWSKIALNFPWTMSAQIRRLLANTPTMNNPSRERLRQLVQSYVATTQFLSYILLSQLWDTLQDYAGYLEVDWEGLLTVTEENFQSYDYVVLLKRTHEILTQMNQKPFVPEISDSVQRLNEDGSSYTPYRFMESVRWRLLRNDVPDSEVRTLCLETEKCLIELLKKASFLTRYRVLTVKNVSFFKPKFAHAEYKHRIGDLYTATKEDMWEDELQMDRFMDSHSVLLVIKSEYENKKVENVLNLSPFVIDSTAFRTGQTISIFNFAFVETDEAGLLRGTRFFNVEYDPNKPDLDDNLWQRIDASTSEFTTILRLLEKFRTDLVSASLRQNVAKS